MNTILRYLFKHFLRSRLLVLLFLANIPDSIAQIIPRYNLAPDSSARADRKKPATIYQLEFENGGMIPNDQHVRETFGEIYYNAINFRMGWQTERGTDTYHQVYNYPIYGIGAYASTFRKKEIGTPFALYGFVAIPISPGAFRRWDFNYRISLGLASNFQTYDEFNNPDNLLLGSHRTVYIDLGFLANYKLSSRYQLGIGLAFHHFSNGSIKQPNKGINLLPLTVSLSYNPGKRTPDLSSQPLPEVDNRLEYHIHYAPGVKQFSLDNRRRYFKSTLGVFVSRPLGYKWSMGLGGDLFYSDSGRDAAIAGEKAGRLNSLLSGGPAFYIDHLLTHNLYLNGNVGVYLKRNEFNGESKPFYLRIGVRSKVFRGYYAGISIKAHMARADYVEWTLGYSWKKRK